MARHITLRDFILRYPSSSLSPIEKEALRHEREMRSQESPDLPGIGMAVTDGSDEDLAVLEADTSPHAPEAQTAEADAPQERTLHFLDPEL